MMPRSPVFAGPWAETRYQWPAQNAECGATIDDCLAHAWLSNPDDAEEYAGHLGRERAIFTNADVAVIADSQRRCEAAYHSAVKHGGWPGLNGQPPSPTTKMHET